MGFGHSLSKEWFLVVVYDLVDIVLQNEPEVKPGEGVEFKCLV
jgi:hypothetical protein